MKLRSAASGAWGLLAQALSLTATFLPVAFQRSDALVVLVTFAAIATVVTPVMSLAAQVRIPAIVSAFNLRVQVIATTIACLIGGVAVFALVFFLESSWGAFGGLGPLVLASLCVSQAFFTLVYALLVRRGVYRDMMLGRLAYAAATLLFTAGVIATSGDGLYLCVAAAGGYIVGAFVSILMLRRTRSARPRRVGPRRMAMLAIRSARRSSALTVSLTIGAFAGQVGALVTPTLGDLSAAWALMMRVMSGFQTLGVVIIGSSVDARISAAARAKDAQAVRSSSRAAVLIGVGIGLLGAVVSVALAVILGATSRADSDFLVFLFAGLGFVGASIALAPIGRILGLVGRPAMRLLWDSLRCLMMMPALLLPTRGALAVLTVAGLLSFASYLALLKRDQSI